jgi:hypothetical protein
MSDKIPLAERSDERITDDVLRCLRIINPIWTSMYPDDVMLILHVRDTLDELEERARIYGRSEQGCMVVEYDPETEAMHWHVTIAYRYPDEEDEDDVH